MCIIFRLNITFIVSIVFYNLLLLCSAVLDRSTSLGTYADGTILFANISTTGGDPSATAPVYVKRQVPGSGSYYNKPQFSTQLHLLYPNGSLSTFDIPFDNNDIRPLNPNYILLFTKDSRLVIMDWTNKTLRDTSIDRQFQAIGTSMDDSRFFVAGINNTQLLYTEYTIENEKIINFNSSINIPETHISKVTHIISLNYNKREWGVVIMKEDVDANFYNHYFLIISPETKSLNTTKVNEDRIPKFFSQIACIDDYNFQYYCLFTSYNDLLWINVHNGSVINLFESICFDSARIYTMPKIGFLVEVKSRKYIKYIVLNVEIDYNDARNAFGERIIDNDDKDFGIDPFILPNNTIVRILFNDKFYPLFTEPLIPEKNPIDGFGLYRNTHIKKVDLSDNGLVSIDTSEINIEFNHPVSPTAAGKISIHYLTPDNEYLLRQRFLCIEPYCNISNNGYSLTIKVLDTTFNMPNAHYSVEIDDNYLRYQNESEQIPGITKGNWMIKTGPNSNNYDSSNEHLIAILHLTINGSQHYENLTKNGKDDFINQIHIEVSNSIPVNKSRLTILKSFFEYDKINKKYLLFIKFKINPPDEYRLDNRTAKDIFDNFTKLFDDIDNNIQTHLDNNSYTIYIDKKFIPYEASNLWDEIKINLQKLIENSKFVAFLIFYISLLIFSYLFGLYMNKVKNKVKDENKESNNLIFFKVTLIIVDIINDISFTMELKDDQHKLLIPSIIFVVIPLLLNIFIAFTIFIFELRENSKFKDWVDEYSIIIRIITLFASGNVELLHLLNSKYAGIPLFDASFSPKALYWIYWDGIVNTIFEDVPQLIIQILYAILFERHYSNLAFFTLVTSSLILLTNIIGLFYNTFAKKYEKLKYDYIKYMKKLQEKEQYKTRENIA